jgi:nucleotide-binding universal stress UspA family protein
MYTNVLVPTDGSAGSDRIVEHAAALADEHGATLHLLYVVNTASFANLPMESSFEGIAATLEEEGRTTLEDAAATAQEVSPGVAVEQVIREGSPAVEIVEYARDGDCDVVAMGTHGRGGLNRILLGSVAERVVRNSPVPVLTVRVGEVPDDTAA